MVETWKVAVMGPTGVGKSCCVVRLVRGIYATNMDPTIADSYQIGLDVDEKPTMLDIIDTAGQEDYRDMRDQFFRECQGFIFMYSIASQESFRGLEELFEQVKLVKQAGEPYAIVVLGNKSDLTEQRQVDRTAALSRIEQEKREKPSVGFLECSALSAEGVAEGFGMLVRALRTLGIRTCNCEQEKQKKCRCKQKCSTCGMMYLYHTQQMHKFIAKKSSFCTIL